MTEETWRAASRPGADPSAPAEFALSRVAPLRGSRRRGAGRRPRPLTLEPAVAQRGLLAREYGFRDVDGSRPDFWRFSDEILERGLEADYADYR